jgi:oligosaccharide repeat unit polymerase
LQRGDGAWLFLHPFSWILYMFFHFCRNTIETSLAFRVDICIAISIFLYSFAFWCAGSVITKNFCFSIAEKYFKIPDLLHNKIMTHLKCWTMIIGIIYLICFWKFRIGLYGTFTNAALAMYSRPLENYVPTLFDYFVNGLLRPIFFLLLVSCIFYSLLQPTRFSLNFGDILLILIYIFSQASTGIKGLVYDILLICAYFIILTNYIRIKSLFQFHLRHIKYLLIILFTIPVIFILAAIRQTYYENFYELRNDISIGNILQGKNIAFETDLDEIFTVPGTTGLSMEIYGRQRPFLGLLHTPYTIIVNPIPRRFFPEKPNTFGRQIAIDMTGNTEVQYSLAASTFGEGYAAYGYFGGFFYSLLFGFFVGIASKFYVVLIKLSDRYEYFIFALLFFMITRMFVRGDMLNAWVASVYNLILFIIFVFFVKITFRMFPK